MFRKITMVLGLALIAFCAHELHQLNERWEAFEAEKAELHKDVILYHEAVYPDIKTYSAKLALPYYSYLEQERLLVQDFNGKPVGMRGHLDVIESAVRARPDFAGASAREVRAFVTWRTPAPEISRLHEALRGVEKLRSLFMWDQIPREASLEEVRVRLDACKEEVSEALRAAREYEA